MGGFLRVSGGSPGCLGAPPGGGGLRGAGRLGSEGPGAVCGGMRHCCAPCVVPEGQNGSGGLGGWEFGVPSP